MSNKTQYEYAMEDLELVKKGWRTELDFSRIETDFLPPELWELTNLTKLDLSDNQLTSLPDEIGNLTSLTELSLRTNKLARLPDAIRKLSNLKKLDIGSNEFECFPDEVVQLSNLTSLTLSHNRLTSLPDEIGKLTNLTSLTLHNNSLTSLPSQIGGLARLTDLDLACNSLTELPREIGLLTQLTSLTLGSSLGGNPLPILPIREISKLKNLKNLDLRHLPIDVPIEILSKANQPQVILDYLAKIMSGQNRRLAEAKMLVVGQGSVGKTSLVKRLTSSDKFNPDENKTDGIVIKRWKVPGQSEISNQQSTIQVNIWDFGGQEIMHATHQFFLTRRSLYLLVLDSRLAQEENRVEYWLKIIQSFGGDSPVLIVCAQHGR